MSATELFHFDSSGIAHKAGEARNSWLGAIAVWRLMERRYLPPYRPADLLTKLWYRPGLSEDEIRRLYGCTPTRVFPSCFTGAAGHDPIEDIWALADDPRVPLADRIVLYTTFDNCLVRRENIPRVIDAMRGFVREDDEWETNLETQAEILEEMLKLPDTIAAGWNQTSISGETWDIRGGYEAETGMCKPYNCLTGTQHFWLFDSIEKE